MSSGTAVIIGNFDGAHLGHAALIHRARRRVGAEGRVVVRAFDPHPLTRLRPGEAPPRLTSFESRSRLLRAAGADEVIRMEPTNELLGMSPDAFIDHIKGAHNPTALVEGPDFRFGRGRVGDIDSLYRLGARHGFEVIVVNPVEVELCDLSIVTVSSSMIRWLLARGRVADAARMLGRPYRMTATVEPGDRRGRAIGVPTANFRPEVMTPAAGVYAGRATSRDGAWRPAAINIGRKPTFDGRESIGEAHLIGFEGAVEDYGWSIEVEPLAFIRDELRFSGLDSLVAQIGRDINRASALLSEAVSHGGRAA